MNENSHHLRSPKSGATTRSRTRRGSRWFIAIVELAPPRPMDRAPRDRSRTGSPPPSGARASPARRPRSGSLQPAPGGSAPAAPPLHPGQARLRNDRAPDERRPPPESGPAPPLFLPHAAGRPRRTRTDRRRRDQAARRAQSGRPVRLDANPQVTVRFRSGKHGSPQQRRQPGASP